MCSIDQKRKGNIMNKEELIKNIKDINGDERKLFFLLGKHCDKIDRCIKHDYTGKLATSEENVYRLRKTDDEPDTFVVVIKKMNEYDQNEIDTIFVCVTDEEPKLNHFMFSLTLPYAQKRSNKCFSYKRN